MKLSFNTHILIIWHNKDVTNKPQPTAQAEATRKGVRKVNLSELKGSLSSRGRTRFADDELSSALVEALSDGEPFIWETAQVTGKTDKQLNACRAKWRNRATSVFDQLPEADTANHKLRVQWTTENEMVLTVYPVQ